MTHVVRSVTHVVYTFLVSLIHIFIVIHDFANIFLNALVQNKINGHLPPPSIIEMFCSIIDKIISGNNFISTSDSKSRIMFGIVIKTY